MGHWLNQICFALSKEGHGQIFETPQCRAVYLQQRGGRKLTNAEAQARGLFNFGGVRRTHPPVIQNVLFRDMRNGGQS